MKITTWIFLYNQKVFSVHKKLKEGQNWYVWIFTKVLENIYDDINKKVNLLNDYKLSPQPANSHLYIQFPNENKYDIKIYDLMGILIDKIELNNSHIIKVDVTDYSKGIYFIEINGIIKKFNIMR